MEEVKNNFSFSKSSLSYKKFKTTVLDKIEAGQVLLYRPGNTDKKHYDDGIIINIERDNAGCKEDIYHIAWRTEYPQITRATAWTLYCKMNCPKPVFFIIK